MNPLLNFNMTNEDFQKLLESGLLGMKVTTEPRKKTVEISDRKNVESRGF